jgi:hypothetical protein
MAQTSNPLSASVQALTLPRGLHLVAVTQASPQRLGDVAEVMLPAVHIGVGPGAAAEGVEILPGPRNNGHWLYETGDTLIIRVASSQAVMLFTTVRSGPLPAIAIEVTRLDRKSATATDAAPAVVEPPQATAVALPRSAAPPLRTADGRQALGVRLDVHIQNKGDTVYVNNFWAGALGERLAIEAFAISPLDGLRPDQIEYTALSETGIETGWVDGGQVCGRKGVATALTGFAIRIKPEQAGAYECEYRGSFSSGRLVGPLKDGAPCRSEPGDRLEAIQLFILPRPRHDAAQPPPVVKAPALSPPVPEPVAARPVGPRFSVFRETSE